VALTFASELTSNENVDQAIDGSSIEPQTAGNAHEDIIFRTAPGIDNYVGNISKPVNKTLCPVLADVGVAGQFFNGPGPAIFIAKAKFILWGCEVNVDHKRAERTSDCIDLTLNPNCIHDNPAIGWNPPALLCNSSGDPLAFCPSVESVTCYLEGATLGSRVFESLDQPARLAPVKSVSVHQRLSQCALA